ncbi:MAG: hypothetical protein LBQ39_06115 [Tannerellaceae bacterium]|jgi:hypothetical protein|nr:hypothetical protein [Tannerellaceae bacterium]
MSASTSKVQSVIENTFTAAIRKLTANESANLISDLYVIADAESGELQIFDEEETLLEKVTIFDWVDSGEEEHIFNRKVIAVLKAVLTILTTKDQFNHPRFLKPLSVSLTDDDFVVIEELLYIDDDTFRLDDPLLKDLDEELDEFLNSLLSDMPK